MINQRLQKKIDRAIKLIQSASKIAIENGCPEIEVCYSGGKDSDVILELTKMSGVPYRAIYKNTTIDPAGTIKHALDAGCEIMRPKETFFHLIEKNGLPSRFKRFCCKFLKEYKVLDYAILGVRREESAKRKKRYKEPEACRVFSKKEKCRQYYPILDWTAQDVADFIEERGIKCHPLYYDENGNFHAERRLGCVGCPLVYVKTRIKMFKEHPNLVKAYIRALKKFHSSHPDSKSAKLFPDVYARFVRDLFYGNKTQSEWDADNRNTLLPPPNYKEFLENYFNITFKD